MIKDLIQNFSVVAYIWIRIVCSQSVLLIISDIDKFQIFGIFSEDDRIWSDGIMHDMIFLNILQSIQKLCFETLDDIKDSLFAVGLNRYKLDDENKMLFLFMAHLYVENNDDNIQFHDIENIYDNDEIPNWIKRSLRSHKNELFAKNLIENVNEDGMARTDAFKLTEKIKEELLGELHISSLGKSDKDLIKHEGLPKKTFIYNTQEKTQIEELQ